MLEDDKNCKALKRHLGARGITLEEYPEKWDLPKDYPMVAANYVAHPSELVKSFGVGQKANTARQRTKAAKTPGAASKKKKQS